MSEKAMVVFSGGQDSTTCLFWAAQNFSEVNTVTFNYGQKHNIEVRSAGEILYRFESLSGGKEIKSSQIIELGEGILQSSSPLVNKEEKVGQYSSIEALPSGIEPTFVPFRNLLFITLAANRAIALGISNLVLGVCEADYAGYPDCRNQFIIAAKTALTEAIASPFHIHTPLMTKTKAESVQLACSLPGCLEALAFSHTCYNGVFPPCGKCHACLLRQKGFQQAGIVDPLLTRDNALSRA